MRAPFASRLVYLFPGQGAQCSGMGKSCYADFPLYRATVEEAEDILHRNLRFLLLTAEERELALTENSQIALFLHSIAVGRVVGDLFPQLVPDTFAGHSLGEFSALHASGLLADFAAALHLVQLRAEWMKQGCEMQRGAMMAILGLNARCCETLIVESAFADCLWVANYNSPLQQVVAGVPTALEALQEAAFAAGARRCVMLKVQGAFHTPLMEQASKAFAVAIHELPLCEREVNFIANAKGDYVTFPELRAFLARQMHSPVRWQSTIETIVHHGGCIFIELGGNILTGLHKRIAKIEKSYALKESGDFAALAEIGKELVCL